jgi:UV DNA damage repair endonuclease
MIKMKNDENGISLKLHSTACQKNYTPLVLDSLHFFFARKYRNFLQMVTSILFMFVGFNNHFV